MVKRFKLFILLFITCISTSYSSSDDLLLDQLSKPLHYETLSSEQLAHLDMHGAQLFQDYINYLAQRADYHLDFYNLIGSFKNLDLPDLKQRFITIYGFEDRDIEDYDDQFFIQSIETASGDHLAWYQQFSTNLLQPLMGHSNILNVLHKIKDITAQGIEFYKENTRNLKEIERRGREQLRRGLNTRGPAVRVRSNGLFFFQRHTFKENADFIAEFSGFVRRIDDLFYELKKLNQSPKIQKIKKTNGGQSKNRNNGRKSRARKIKNPSSSAKGTATISKIEAEDLQQASVSIINNEHENSPTKAAMTEKIEQSIDLKIDAPILKDVVKDQEDEIQSEKLIQLWIGELVDGKLSVENYHRRLHQLYTKEKTQGEEHSNINEEQVPSTYPLASRHYETLKGVYAYSNNIKWHDFEIMITSDTGFKGTVLSNNGGSAATIKFPHPLILGSYVQFVMHKPHPAPCLYDALMKRFIKNLGLYGLAFTDFQTK